MKSASGRGIAQAVGMMARAVLHQHGDATAQLLVDFLDGGRVPAQQRINAAADVEQRHVIVGEGTDAHDEVAVGIVRRVVFRNNFHSQSSHRN